MAAEQAPTLEATEALVQALFQRAAQRLSISDQPALLRGVRKVLARRPSADQRTAWIRVQNTFGAFYRQLEDGDLGENIEQAIKCFESARKRCRRDDHQNLRAAVLVNLCQAYADRTRGSLKQNAGLCARYGNEAIPLLGQVPPDQLLACFYNVGVSNFRLGRLREAALALFHADSVRRDLVSSDAHPSIGSSSQRGEFVTALFATVRAISGDVDGAVDVLERGRGIGIQQWRFSASEEPRPVDLIRSLVPRGGAIVQLAVGEHLAIATIVPDGSDAPLTVANVILVPGLTAKSLHHLTAALSGMFNVLTGKRSFAEIDGRGVPAIQAALQLLDGRGDRELTQLTTAEHLYLTNFYIDGLLDHLWNTLLEPIHQRLRSLGVGEGADIVLMPLGDLAVLPLHAACSSESQEAFLEHYVVRYAPSGLLLNQSLRRLVELQSAGVIDAHGRGTDLGGLFNPMKGTRAELKNAESRELPLLEELFARTLRRPCRAHVGAQATLERLMTGSEEGGISDANYIHLACHGRFEIDDAEGAGLQLAGNRWLTVETIWNELALTQNRLTFLSACNTGLVDVDYRPDEFIGLPAAFLGAGACGVLATMWSILDEPMPEIARRVYELHLVGADGRGMSPAAAMRQTVLELRRGELFPATHASPLRSHFQTAAVWAALSFHGV